MPDEDDPLVLVSAAIAAEEAGSRDEAESILKEAIARYPGCAEAYTRLGFILNDADRLEEAREMFVAGLAIRESQPALTLLGLVERNLGHRDAALVALRRSLELAPDDDEAHHILGTALMDDEPLEAIAHFQRAHDIDPGLPHLLREWVLLGQPWVRTIKNWANCRRPRSASVRASRSNSTARISTGATDCFSSASENPRRRSVISSERLRLDPTDEKARAALEELG